jgi:hypothetical protein
MAKESGLTEAQVEAAVYGTGGRMETETLSARYPVELVAKGRAHYYKVTHAGREMLLPGVTGILAMIGGDKTQKLIGWAKKEALGSVERELRAFGADPVVMEPEVISGIIERAKKKPTEVLDAAADYGTRLHDYCDRIIKGLPVSPDDDLAHSALAFKDWFSAQHIEVLMGDTAVASLDHGYGGKFDAIGVKDGKLGIVDFKTSNGIREDYALQVAAYARAAQETYGANFDWGLIVRFSKTSQDYEIKWVKDMDRAFDGFYAAKTLKEIITGELYV